MATYAGLAECVYHMTGESHTAAAGKELVLEIMQYMNNACDRKANETNIGFSIYGTLTVKYSDLTFKGIHHLLRDNLAESCSRITHGKQYSCHIQLLIDSPS